ncbi:MAG: hypothetical protein Q4F49_09010 [Pseudoxanthomonas suwonensis]|nr:hypothetical protein [Pseudoxanthomonas suwonensis]
MLTLPLLLAITACSAPADNEQADQRPTPATDPMQGDYPDAMAGAEREVDPALLAPAAPRAMRGAYVFGHEAETFQECGNSVDWWADGDDADLEPLRKLAREQAEQSGDPYRPIYVEATGELLGKDEAAGFPSAFDNVVRLSAVTRSAAKVPDVCMLPLQ